MFAAAQAAQESGVPWVLDPVAAGATRFRMSTVEELLKLNPTIVKGNASEIAAIAGIDGGGKGVDSTLDSQYAVDVAKSFAASIHAVVVVTGATDFATDGDEVIAIPGGDILMTKVTGTGCALGGLMAAFCAVTPTRLRAATAACAVFAAAAESAGRAANGPGSFAMHFLDELASLGAA